MRQTTVAPLLIVALAAAFALWGRYEGGYFGADFYPVAIVLFAVAVAVSLTAPLSLRLARREPAVIAAGALGALAAWSALSALWSPIPEVAVADALRIAVYAVAFAAGVWLCSALASHMGFSLWPPVIAAGFAGAAAILEMLAAGGQDVVGDIARLLEEDGTLQFPLGYRNANAAFFFICLLPAVSIAADRERHPVSRGVALAVGTLCVDLALLSQSRASILAVIAALTVLVLVSPRRARTLAWVGLAALPAVAILPTLTELFDGARDASAQTLSDEVHSAGVATALTTAASLAIGLLVTRLDRVRRVPAPSNRAIGIGIVATLAATVIAFVAAVGDPIDWIEQRVDEFEAAQTPDFSTRETRFEFDAASGRSDLWRVAVDAGFDDPLRGEGGGGFEYRYTLDRDVDQQVRDAHSVELEVFSELGLPGLALLAVAIAAMAIGAVRSVRIGPRAAALSAASLAAGTYWLLHASVEWLWAYPVVTAVALTMMGCACAPAILAPTAVGPGRSRRLRVPLAATCGVLALVSIPLWMADRQIEDATENWTDDLEAAYADLESAASLNPLTIDPLLIEGTLARASGDPERAIEAFEKAKEERPALWTPSYQLAQLYSSRDPARAREELDRAFALNPIESRLFFLRKRFDARDIER